MFGEYIQEYGIAEEGVGKQWRSLSFTRETL